MVDFCRPGHKYFFYLFVGYILILYQIARLWLAVVGHYKIKSIIIKACLLFCRCSLMGFDLNRHWNDPSPWAHPTLCATKDLVMGYDQDPVSDHYVIMLYSSVLP